MENFSVNIGHQQQNTRRNLGIATLIFAVILSVLAIANDWDPIISGVIIYLIYLTGVLSILEARYKVCAINALRNMESMTGRFSLGQEMMEEKKCAYVRQIAKKEILQAVVISIVPTIIVLIL